MDRFRELSVFVRVAESGGFAAAARSLGTSPPAVTRAVSSLEARIGARLFSRTTRIVRLTEAGRRLLEDGRRILADLDEAEGVAAGSHAEPRGQLDVTSSLLFGRNFVLPLMMEFMTLYPNVTARGLFIDRPVNLIDEGIDVGVRIGNLPDSSLAAVRVGQIRRVVCGAPEYFEKHGEPRTPEELRDHRLIMASGMTQRPEWHFRQDGETYGLAIEPRLVVSDNDSAISAAASGWGLTHVLGYQIRSQLDEGRLRTVLDDFEIDPWPLHVVHVEGRRASAKVRAFVDFLVDRLRADESTN